jgi:hypothetical protein
LFCGHYSVHGHMFWYCLVYEVLLNHVAQLQSLFNVECDVRLHMGRKLGMDENHAKHGTGYWTCGRERFSFPFTATNWNLLIDEFSFYSALEMMGLDTLGSSSCGDSIHFHQTRPDRMMDGQTNTQKARPSCLCPAAKCNERELLLCPSVCKYLNKT